VPGEKRAAFQVSYPHPKGHDFLKALRRCNNLSAASVVPLPLWLTAVFGFILEEQWCVSVTEVLLQCDQYPPPWHRCARVKAPANIQ